MLLTFQIQSLSAYRQTLRKELPKLAISKRLQEETIKVS